MISIENLSYSISLVPSEDKAESIILAFIQLVFRQNLKR